MKHYDTITPHDITNVIEQIVLGAKEPTTTEALSDWVVHDDEAHDRYVKAGDVTAMDERRATLDGLIAKALHEASHLGMVDSVVSKPHLLGGTLPPGSRDRFWSTPALSQWLIVEVRPRELEECKGRIIALRTMRDALKARGIEVRFVDPILPGDKPPFDSGKTYRPDLRNPLGQRVDPRTLGQEVCMDQAHFADMAGSFLFAVPFNT